MDESLLVHRNPWSTVFVVHVPDTSRTIAGCVGGNVEMFFQASFCFISDSLGCLVLGVLPDPDALRMSLHCD